MYNISNISRERGAVRVHMFLLQYHCGNLGGAFGTHLAWVGTKLYSFGMWVGDMVLICLGLLVSSV